MKIDPYTATCGVIAVLVLARLWFVLGRKNGNEQEPRNPFGASVPNTGGLKRIPFSNPGAMDDPTDKKLLHPPQSLAGQLEQMKNIDKLFDEKQFLRGAKDAFTRIVTAFAAGDLSPVAKLLGPNVAQHFQAAIDARRKAGKSLKNRIARIRDTETVAADLAGTIATITVRIASDQENVLYDQTGSAISGVDGRLEQITDVWAFSRDLKSDNPDWVLVETKS